jgi:hypothetical protein
MPVCATATVPPKTSDTAMDAAMPKAYRALPMLTDINPSLPACDRRANVS